MEEIELLKRRRQRPLEVEERTMKTCNHDIQKHVACIIENEMH